MYLLYAAESEKFRSVSTRIFLGVAGLDMRDTMYHGCNKVAVKKFFEILAFLRKETP